jgi:uncharacterized repeat protein (TIGR03803 family)
METKMESVILRTLRATQGATTFADGLFTSAAARSRKENNVRKLSLLKMACIVSVFCAVTAIPSPAQESEFHSLFSFDGSCTSSTAGANPGYGNLVQGKDGKLYGTTEVCSGSEGTVFKFATTASKPTTLYVFCTPQGDPLCLYGAKPVGGLTLASNGKFYGTTYNGGGGGDNGTVFQITSAGKLTNVYDFLGSTTGSEPQAAPFQAKDGNLYGTTSIGGSSNLGTLYEMTTAGANEVTLSFTGKNGELPYARLVQGTNQNIYGTTSQATSGNGTVFAILPKTGFATLYTFKGAAKGGYPFGGLIQASNGNFYGTTSSGGANGQGGTVFSMTPAGKVTTIYNFCSKPNCTDGRNPEASLIQATDGNLYGTTYNGGANSNPNCLSNSGCGTIFQITTAGKLTTLYNFCGLESCADGNQPEGGLVQATNGTFYGTTSSGGTDFAGTVFSLSVEGMKPFVKTLPAWGTEGDRVTILGTNLTGASKVSFSGTAAKTFTVVSDTEITATVPTDAATGTIEVTTPSGTLNSDVDFEVTP